MSGSYSGFFFNNFPILHPITKKNINEEKRGKCEEEWSMWRNINFEQFSTCARWAENFDVLIASTPWIQSDLHPPPNKTNETQICSIPPTQPVFWICFSELQFCGVSLCWLFLFSVYLDLMTNVFGTSLTFQEDCSNNLQSFPFIENWSIWLVVGPLI